MDNEIKELIHQRAKQIHHITKHRILEQNDETFETSEAFRFAYLVLGKPRRFKKTFESGKLTLDELAVESVYQRYRVAIAGFPVTGLMPEEARIIADHNEYCRLEELESKLLPSAAIELNRSDDGAYQVTQN